MKGKGLVRYVAVAGLFLGLLPRPGGAHCDSVDGPVIKDARAALESGKVARVLKWIRPDHEKEVREVFDQAMAVRAAGGTARALADRLFFETLVRLHREGEGAPFTGLKPAGSVDPPIKEADESLERGSVDGLARSLAGMLEEGIRRRFRRALKKQKEADASVGQGREFVAAYVDYVHFIERLHQAAAASGGHEGAEAGNKHIH